MVRFLLPLTLLIVMGACAPATSPTFDRDGENVTVNVPANQDLYNTTLHVKPASTEDKRCFDKEGPHVSCSLGDIPEGETVQVRMVSPSDPEDLSCLVGAFLEPGPIASYRPFPCTAR